ncbi:uncharacterized protein B4U79_06785 [Dinothrombium tinctorium]|uniref:Protein NDRG3-like protein n=1 Tax=Dinothrombium tinctorium TaxID=1965070 RepID=A0A3S3PCY0_9ACAR|nr:uncharacterized protein B4U79_06785 [Dinothrombium tinctorium]
MSSNLHSVKEEDGSNNVSSGGGGGGERKSSSGENKPHPLKTIELNLEKFGKVKVHIQGDLQEKNKKAVFLTVHDIGSNHSSFRDFIEHRCMTEIKLRSIFIHLDLPGQHDNADDYEDEYPTIQQLGEEFIPQVLDNLKVNLVVGIGEGAGANILVAPLPRLSNAHSLKFVVCVDAGLVLIDLVTAGVGMLEKLKESFFSGKRRASEAFQSPEQVIALHKLGQTGGSSGSQHTDSLLVDYKSRVANLNAKNLRKYVEAYMNRRDITDKMSSIHQLDTLLVTGGKSPFAQGVISIYSKMDKEKTSLLKIDNAADVLSETPEKFAQSLLLFVKGLGYLTSLTLPGVERQRTFSGESNEMPNKSLGAIGRRRTLSMEEYDLPRPRRLSLTTSSSGSAAATQASPTK